MVMLRFSLPNIAMLLLSLLLDPKWRKLRLALAILMYLTILVAGSIPGARAEIGHYASGAVLHSLAYAMLAFLWFTSCKGGPSVCAAKALLAVAVMGAGDEFVQSFFPYRGAAVADWMVDVAAAAVTSAVLWAVLPRPAQAS